MNQWKFKTWIFSLKKESVNVDRISPFLDFLRSIEEKLSESEREFNKHGFLEFLRVVVSNPKLMSIEKVNESVISIVCRMKLIEEGERMKILKYCMNGKSANQWPSKLFLMMNMLGVSEYEHLVTQNRVLNQIVGETVPKTSEEAIKDIKVMWSSGDYESNFDAFKLKLSQYLQNGKELDESFLLDLIHKLDDKNVKIEIVSASAKILELVFKDVVSKKLQSPCSVWVIPDFLLDSLVLHSHVFNYVLHILKRLYLAKNNPLFLFMVSNLFDSMTLTKSQWSKVLITTAKVGLFWTPLSMLFHSQVSPGSKGGVNVMRKVFRQAQESGKMEELWWTAVPFRSTFLSVLEGVLCGGGPDSGSEDYEEFAHIVYFLFSPKFNPRTTNTNKMGFQILAGFMNKISQVEKNLGREGEEARSEKELMKLLEFETSSGIVPLFLRMLLINSKLFFLGKVESLCVFFQFFLSRCEDENGKTSCLLLLHDMLDQFYAIAKRRGKDDLCQEIQKLRRA